MRFRNFWLFALVVWMMSTACVPNKKYLYLQKQDLHTKNLSKDSVYRSYTQPAYVYKVQPHDALFIDFQSATEDKFDFLSDLGGGIGGGGGGGGAMIIRSELVDDAGEISFPVIGKVKVAGLSVFQIQDSLQLIADAYLEGPKVRVRLVNFRFTVLGEVNSEGTHTTFNSRVSLPEALGLAGGLGELADRANIKLIRQQGQTTEVLYLNLLDESLIDSPYYYINQADILVVPPLKQRPFRKYFGSNFAIFTSTLSVILLVINLTANN